MNLQKNQNQTPKYEFIDKAVFFPEQGILAVGDLHLGYDSMMEEVGIFIPQSQVKETISNLEKIFELIEKKDQKIKKIVFIGDIKHAFAFRYEEKDEFQEIYNFLKKKFKEEDIILIKGNHDTIDYSYGKIKEFYIEDGIAFIHGHEQNKKINSKEVKVVVTGHLHPSVIIHEKGGPKNEEYKCFLEGTFHGKTFIVLPSFLEVVEGTSINDLKEYFIEDFSIIPKKEILKFKVYVVSGDDPDGKVYEFGKVEDF